MHVRTLPNVDIDYLDAVLLDGAGRMRLLGVASLREYPHDHLLVWAQKRGRYGFPTRELIARLKTLIGSKRVIEIGAGMGDLGFHLGITMTDSYIQTSPEMQLLYHTMGAKPIEPPPDVERLDAAAAVRKYKPEVVLASWVTQLYQPGDEGPPKKIGSSIYGVDEIDILAHCAIYIHVGNTEVHGDKRLLQRPHVELQGEPGLVSRGFDQSKNLIYVWGI